MPIIFYCPACGRELRVRLIAAGRKGSCLDCGEKVLVPDFNPNAVRLPPVTNPAAESEHKPEMFESSTGIPTIEAGFVDDDAEL